MEVAGQLVYSLPTNINDATKQGVYYKSSYTIEGVCSNADVLIHVMKSPSFIVQMLFDVSVIPAAWYRTRRLNGDWVAWSKIA